MCLCVSVQLKRPLARPLLSERGPQQLVAGADLYHAQPDCPGPMPGCYPGEGTTVEPLYGPHAVQSALQQEP